MLPRLTTARLVLDAFTLDDDAAVAEICAHPDVYASTLKIPRPYTLDDARTWIAGHLPGFLKGEVVDFAIRAEGKLVGNISLIIRRKHDCGILGYWMGRPHWGQGYATEAVRAVVTYGFQQQALEKIEAQYLAGNDASRRVLEKSGLVLEGRCARHCKKDGQYFDTVLYGITRAQAEAAGLISSNTAGLSTTPPALAVPLRPRNPEDPPYLEELVLPNATYVERGLLQRHFLGKNVAALEEELRVYGKSLAPDFANLAPAALGYYLKSAQNYLTSEHSEGDWDFAHGLVSALAPRARDGGLPEEIRAQARAVIRHVHDQAARYFIEADKQPFAGWVAEALAE